MMTITLLVLLALAALADWWWFPLRRWHYKRTASKRLRKELQTSDELIERIKAQEAAWLRIYKETQHRLTTTPYAVLHGAERNAVRKAMDHAWALRMENQAHLGQATRQREEFAQLLKKVEEFE